MSCIAADDESMSEPGTGEAKESAEVAAINQALSAPKGVFTLNANCESKRGTIQAVTNRVMQLLYSTPSDAKFTKWFGVLKSNSSAWTIYHSAVSGVAAYEQESMQLIGAAARETSAHLITFRCDSISNVNAAQVVPNTFDTDSPVIRLNSRFFSELALNSNVVDYESQSSVLIHELAHLATSNKFDPMVQPGTNMYDYAQELAQTSPSRALSNPDNYGYYFGGL
jgi:Lysine-specific metallo-endopeptidase